MGGTAFVIVLAYGGGGRVGDLRARIGMTGACYLVGASGISPDGWENRPVGQ